MFVLISTLSIKAQCNQACNLKIINKIDCQVMLKIKYTCGVKDFEWDATLLPGDSITPFILNAPAIMDCSCMITSVEMISIGGANPPIGPRYIPPGGTTVTYMQPPLAGCCPTNYAKYDGCNIELWMQCN